MNKFFFQILAVLLLLGGIWTVLWKPVPLFGADLCDIPLETAVITAPPIIIFVLDNSSSMNVEFVTPEPQGLFRGYYYLFPDSSYIPVADNHFGSGKALSATDRFAWQSQWAGYNYIYYSPRQNYHPWPSSSQYTFNPADQQYPLSDPTKAEEEAVKISLAATFFSIGSNTGQIDIPNAHYFTFQDENSNGIKDNGEVYFLVTWQDSNHDGVIDLGHDLRDDHRRYFRLIDNGNNVLESNELVEVKEEKIINRLRPLHDETGASPRKMTDSEELQNFANWFTYYRRREYLAKAFIAESIMHLQETLVGLVGVNHPPLIEAQFVQNQYSESSVIEAEGHVDRLLNAIYRSRCQGQTPLRNALNLVGRYLENDNSSSLGNSPFFAKEQGGGCQKACAVVLSDGYWNGSFSGAGNADGDNGRPFADSWADTLADIAMTYYEKDLRNDLPNLVPSTTCDPAKHQHMNTYVLSFAPVQSFNAPQYYLPPYASCVTKEADQNREWLQPSSVLGIESTTDSNVCPVKETANTALMQDLEHAAINGRGSYFSAYSDQPLADLMGTLPDILSAFQEPVSSADLAVNGLTSSEQSRIFQALYVPEKWHGNVSAYEMSDKEDTLAGEPLWQAAEYLNVSNSRLWDQRCIITYGGRRVAPHGVPFRYRTLSDKVRKELGSNLVPGSAAEKNAMDMVDYLRGRSFEKYRHRESLLGDIVHSSPVIFGRTLFAGANDGFLHAFDTDTGMERFAYSPALIANHLSILSDPYYEDHHRFYVDGPLFVGEVLQGIHHRLAYLVGGLGKGGKGYFCLRVAARERTSSPNGFGDYQWTYHVDEIGPDTLEEQIAEHPIWEYPRPDSANDGMDNNGDGIVDETGEQDPHIGYSYGQGYVVNANVVENSFRPVVIFGNGYDSASGKAVLFILDADSGQIVRKIDTGAAGDNGLSTPALVDVDLDRQVDYAYAGDLKGNLWKFDLTSDNPEQWGVAYGEDHDGDGRIDATDGDWPAPLFQTEGQPITGRPEVMFMGGSYPGYMVFVGTGRYLGRSDLNDKNQQSIYALWDYGDDSDDSEHLGKITDRTAGTLSGGLALYKKEIAVETTENGMTYRRLSETQINYRTIRDEEDGDNDTRNNSTERKVENPERFAGWFLDFPQPEEGFWGASERVVGDAIVRGGTVIIPSFVPTRTPCGGGGDSWLYIADAYSGNTPTGLQNNAVLTTKISGKINDRLMIINDPKTRGKDKIIFSDYTGCIQIMETIGEKWGRVYWRQNP